MEAASFPESRFLTKSGISREVCHDIAKSLSSTDHVIPTPVQGANSYTLRVGDLVMQFRSAEVDLSIHNKAMKVHGSRYVPFIKCKQSKPFYVYTSPYRGKSHSEHGISSISFSIRKNTVIDLAIFFAQSCHHPVNSDRMGIKMNVIESFLLDCLNLPELRQKVQNLPDNLRMLLNGA